MKSQSFEQSENFYIENKTRLLSLLESKVTFDIDYQAEWDQVAVWFKGELGLWCLCYQNSDMNGNDLGQPHWNNDGANDGLDHLRHALSEDEDFNALVAENEFWENEYLNDFINDFCKKFAEDNAIANYFEVNKD